MGNAVIPQDWEGEYCTYAVCWPNSPGWLAVLRGVLSIPSQGRFWNEQTGTITEAQAVIEETFDYNFRNEAVIMACNDTVAQALLSGLSAIANSLNNGGCGGSSTAIPDTYCYSTSNGQIVANITLNDGSQQPVYGSKPIAVLPESGYPVGYPDEDTYLADKCAKANQLVNDFINTCRSIGNYTWFESVLGVAFLVACFAALITVPVAAIPVILYLLLTTATLSALFVEFANYADDHKFELVCILVKHSSVESVLVAIGDWIDVALAFLDPEAAAAVALKKILLLFLSADTLNKLFNDEAKEVYPITDCVDCDAPLYVAGFGTVLENSSTVARINADETSGYWVVYANFYISNGVGGNFYPNNPTELALTDGMRKFSVEIVDGVFTPAGGATYWGSGSPLLSVVGYKDFDVATEPTYNTDVDPSEIGPIRSLAMISSTNFAVELTVIP